MPAWSLSGSMLLALTAPAVGDRVASPSRGKEPLRIVDIAPRGTYGVPAQPSPDVRTGLATADRPVVNRDHRFDRPPMNTVSPAGDPQADSVRALLRDRRAKRGGADARVEWRLSGGGSDLGIGGGLARAVGNLLHD